MKWMKVFEKFVVGAVSGAFASVVTSAESGNVDPRSLAIAASIGGLTGMVHALRNYIKHAEPSDPDAIQPE